MENKVSVRGFLYFLMQIVLFVRETQCQAIYKITKDDCNKFLELEERLNDRIQQLEISVKKLIEGPGSTYVRWGKTSCPEATATMIYTGYIAGKHRFQQGSGTNALCLHSTPKWGSYLNGTQGGRAFVYGGEYEPDHGSSENLVPGLIPDGTNDQIAPCTVCKTNTDRITLMIPGTNECEDGWIEEYDGHLMASKLGDAGANEYLCVDKTADFISGGINYNEFLLYPTEAKCGALKCPPYVDGRELACVICSI